MKIAITRLGGNITNKNRKLIGNFETLMIAELLKKFDSVDVLSCNDCEGCIKVDENFDINQYDRLLVVNDSANMFGGAEIKTMTIIYKLLAKYNNKIKFILTDLSLPFVNYWELIKNKPWNNYREEDFKLKFPIDIISQGKDLEIARKIHKNIDIDNIVYVPLNEWGAFLLQPVYESERPIDLIYGGNFRSGRREKKFIDYFFNKDISVEMYGNIRESQFKLPYTKAPTFAKKVPADEVVKYNSRALATLILGDSNYNNNIVTLRFIEALMSNCICFIDNDFDKVHSLLPDEFYVNNGLELEAKVKKLKTDSTYYNFLINQQRQVLQNIIQNNMPEKLYKSIL